MSSGPTITCVGLCTLDIVQYYAERPSWGGKGVAAETLVDVGGPAANASVTIGLLGGRASLVTAVGEGAEARLARERLEAHALRIRDCADAGSTLPVSSIWVDRARGERTVLSTNRVASVVPPDPAVVDDDCAAVLIDGHHPGLAQAISDRAHARGIPIVLDGGSWRPVFDELLGVADVAIVSGTFRLPSDDASGPDLARAIRKTWGTRCVAVTRGPRDVVWIDGEHEGRTPVPPCDARDTLGAGDVLHGAYVWLRYGRGWSHERSLREACTIASASCAHLGAREGVRVYVGSSA